MRYHVDGWIDEAGFAGEAGAGIGDFQTYVTTDPHFAAAWGDIDKQLKLEGVDQSQLNTIKNQFTSTYEQLSTQVGVMGKDAIDAAKKYITMGKTVAGAVATVEGLVKAVQSGASPVAVMQAFTGTMIGLMAAAGVAMPAIGAAIVGAIMLAMKFLEDAGLFHQDAPIGTQVCPGIYCDPKPPIVVNCCCIWSDTPHVMPGAGNWRSFPNPTDTQDAPWYRDNNVRSYLDNRLGVEWRGITRIVYGALQGTRPIDKVFPAYSKIERYLSQGTDFQKAFATAWKGNAEYVLNGLSPQSDALVLIHTLRIWNTAHAAPQEQIHSGSQGYIESLVREAQSVLMPSDPLVVGTPIDVAGRPTALWVHVGARHDPLVHAGIADAFVLPKSAYGGLAAKNRAKAAVAATTPRVVPGLHGVHQVAPVSHVLGAANATITPAHVAVGGLAAAAILKPALLAKLLAGFGL